MRGLGIFWKLLREMALSIHQCLYSFPCLLSCIVCELFSRVNWDSLRPPERWSTFCKCGEGALHDYTGSVLSCPAIQGRACGRQRWHEQHVFLSNFQLPLGPELQSLNSTPVLTSSIALLHPSIWSLWVRQQRKTKHREWNLCWVKMSHPSSMSNDLSNLWTAFLPCSLKELRKVFWIWFSVLEHSGQTWVI